MSALFPAAEIVWLSLSTLLASCLGYLSAANLRVGAIHRYLGYEGIAIVVLVVHVGTAIGLGAWVSITRAIVGVSLITLVWALLAYFSLQRFANPLDRPGVVLFRPLLLPLITLVAFVSSLLALALYTPWYFGAIPFLAWFILGFLTAEAAVRRYMRECRQRGTECDRRLAIFAVNDAQGRGHPSDSSRYPFP